MASRNTWVWVTLAVGLFAFVWFFERHWSAPVSGAPLILPGLKPEAVTSVQVRPLDLRAERVNGEWQLTRPLRYPARADAIESLLTNLAQLQAQTHIPAAELRQHTNMDAEFGFNPAQASLLIQETGNRHQLLVGARTPPGDQVFLQVVGAEGLYVVNADWLKLVPQTANEWRDPGFVCLQGLAFDRLVVTNQGAAFELQRGAARSGWQLTQPRQARADNAKIAEAFRALEALRVTQFVTDHPPADAESYGLQPPELSLTLAQGTNLVLQLAFGTSPTNATNQVFARRLDRSSVMLVPREPLARWCVKFDDFRDRHLLALDGRTVDRIEVRGSEEFALQRQSGQAWRLLPHDLPADRESVENLITNLTGLRVSHFVKDVVIEPNLTNYGLATPTRQLVLKTAAPDATATNGLLGQLDFGATEEERTYVRRPDEDAVYAVRAADFQRLPGAAFQFRERRIWHQSEEHVARVLTRQAGKTRELIRNGTNSWSLAPGSQGIINPDAVEETVHRLGQLYAMAWVAVGEPELARHGFQADGLEVTLVLKSGDQLSVRFGGGAPSGLTYAATTLAGQVWIFECPPSISELARAYLTIPASGP